MKLEALLTHPEAWIRAITEALIKAEMKVTIVEIPKEWENIFVFRYKRKKFQIMLCRGFHQDKLVKGARLSKWVTKSLNFKQYLVEQFTWSTKEHLKKIFKDYEIIDFGEEKQLTQWIEKKCN